MSADKPYRLAVKAVILDARKRCLVIRRSNACRNFVGCWEWPGGKVDPEEEFATAVIREVREETSLEVEITGFTGATCFEMPAVHVVLLCMAARIRDGEIRLSEEHDQFAWVPLAELERWRLPEQLRPLMLEYAQRK
jgi:8-oxo-dGTP diphosphatase